MRQSWVHRAGYVLTGLGLWSGLLMSMVVCQQVSAQGIRPASQSPTTNRLARLPDDAVTLAFRDAEIAEVISAFSTSMGVPFLLDARVKGKMTLETPEPVSLDQAYELLVAVLSLQGFAVVSADGYAKVVPTAEAKSQFPAIDSNEMVGGLATRG